MTLQSKNSERGFTIVELLIVIIVIGILATLVLVAYGNVQGQARDTKRQSNAQSVANAAETYKTSSTTGYYPRMDSSTNFQSDISTAGNYTNGVATITVDKSVTQTTATTPQNLLTVGSTGNNGNGGYNLVAQWCGTSTPLNETTATGVKIYYYKEASKAVNNFIQTGTGC